MNKRKILKAGDTIYPGDQVYDLDQLGYIPVDKQHWFDKFCRTKHGMIIIRDRNDIVRLKSINPLMGQYICLKCELSYIATEDNYHKHKC